MKTIGFFNNKAGVGTTSLVYHVAWMLAQIGMRVIAADLDPQASLSATFLDHERLAELWQAQPQPTIYGTVLPWFVGMEVDIQPSVIEPVGDNIGLLVGALELSRFEDEFAEAWHNLASPDPRDAGDDTRAFAVTNVFHHLISRAGSEFAADIGLIDIGPNLTALNRAALVACDYLVIPLGADLFSLHNLPILGPTLRGWRLKWRVLLKNHSHADTELPGCDMNPAGYVLIRHSVPVIGSPKTYGKQMERIPAHYMRWVLELSAGAAGAIETDPNCLANLKDYRSLMLLAQEARKPMFFLRPADGAFGAHQKAVQECRADFDRLAHRIMQACGIAVPKMAAAGRP